MKNTNMRKTNQRIGFTLMAVAWLLGLPVMAAGGPPDIRWAGLNLLARFKIREGLGFCVDLMNEFDWGCELDQCASR